jgi:predicted RNase H-like nuclease (RuvC/YqgF family)
VEADFQKGLLDGLIKLQKDVKSLKSTHKKLANKFDNIEIQDFHNQIQAIDKRIRALELQIQELRETVRYTQLMLARFEMDFLQLHVNQTAEQQGKTSEIREHVLVAFTNAINQAANSTEPMKVVIEFRKHLKTYANEHRIKAFLD